MPTRDEYLKELAEWVDYVAELDRSQKADEIALGETWVGSTPETLAEAMAHMWSDHLHTSEYDLTRRGLQQWLDARNMTAGLEQRTLEEVREEFWQTIMADALPQLKLAKLLGEF